MTSRTAAWQPLTFGGVAAFAGASLARTAAVALLIATIVAATLVWFFHTAWEPSLRTAIARLPEKGAIRRGQLEWYQESPVRLTEGTFLSIVVDPTGRGETGQVADVQWEFHPQHLRIRSLLGYVDFRYPANWTAAFSRTGLEAWWGAWQSAVLAGLGVASGAGCLAIWTILATLYLWPARIVARLAARPIHTPGAWRLALASLMPGAMLLSAALMAYGLQRLNLVQLLFAWIVHWVVGWVFVLISPLYLPRQDRSRVGPCSENPFAGDASEKEPRS